MKTFALATVALLAMSTPAVAVTVFNSNPAADGYGIDGPPPFLFTLFSSNNETGSNYTFTKEVSHQDVNRVFYWRHDTVDGDGPREDPAGFWINGVFTQLTEDDVSLILPEDIWETQYGWVRLSLKAGDEWGFYIATTDGREGRGAFSVGIVPEPATWAMFIAGFGLVGAAARRRRGTLAAKPAR